MVRRALQSAYRHCRALDAMTPYWLLFSYFLLGTMFTDPAERQRMWSAFFLTTGLVIVCLMIGLRDHVGGDWEPYLIILKRAARWTLATALSRDDPGYMVLNWFAQRVDAGIWLVNLGCALAFTWGLARFARVQPDPWLAVLVAIPYLVIVIAMGYTRQGAAIGIVMAGLAALHRGATSMRFAAYVAVAALFHSTAVMVLPLVALATRESRLFNLLSAAASTYILFNFFLGEHFDYFISGYIDREYNSQGALIRVLMGVVPGLIYLASANRFGFDDAQRRLWRNFSIAALLFFVLLFVLPSSTAVDRLALYIIPLQIAVLGRVPVAFPQVRIARPTVILFLFAIQFTWLNFSLYAQYWVPYRLTPIG